MKTFVSLILCFCLIVLSVIAFSPGASALGAAGGVNTEERHAVCTSLSDGARAYYSGKYSYDRLVTLSGAADASDSCTAMQDNELFDALHALMSDTHAYRTTYSGYKKGSLAYFWSSTDSVLGSDTYVMFYSDVSGDAAALNREHVWPKSRASFGTKNGGSDLHHLRPAADSVNLAKSNHTFGDIRGVYNSFTESGVNGTVCCWVNKSADLFECRDEVKGDVARILLYVYCRWEQPNLYSDVPAALLPAGDSDSTSNSGERVIENLSTLLSWCAEDPVDTWEMRRNDLTESVQGNRNVFIDYPELAWRLFGSEPPGGMTTPSSGDERLRGDADGDGKITLIDATLIQRYIAFLRFIYIDTDAADADGDKEVGITDAACILRYIAGVPLPYIGD